MDTVRYVLAVVIWATIPPAFLYWYLIHPFAGYWRTVGPARTYLVVIPVTLLLMGMLLRWRGPVDATDLGEHWGLFYAGLIVWVASIFLERRVRRQLDFRTLAGVPELIPPGAGAGGPDTSEGEGEAASAPPVLLTEGMYRFVRHPRYLTVFIATAGWSMMANNGAAYAVAAALVPLIAGLVFLEERELVDRFGQSYRDYQARVPAFIPRIGRR